MSSEPSALPWRAITTMRWSSALQMALALAAIAAGGVLRLQDDQHVTRYVSPAGITTVIVEGAGARFGDAFACSAVRRTR